MPLSEREQRIFDEISTSLLREDPRLAQPPPPRRERKLDDPRRKAKLGAGLFVCGLVALLVFFLSRSLPVGLLAFGAMVGGALIVAGAGRAALAQRTKRVRRPRAPFSAN